MAVNRSLSRPTADPEYMARRRQASNLSRTFTIILMAIVPITLIGGATLLLWEKDQVKEAVLIDSVDRMRSLEEQVVQVNQSMEEMHSQFRTDVRNITRDVERVRNAGISAEKKNRRSMNNQISTLDKKVTAHLSAINKQLQSISSAQQKLVEDIVAMRSLQNTLNKTIADIRNLQSTDKRNQNELQLINRKLVEMEQWKKSVDTYRRDINRRLTEIRNATFIPASNQ